MRRIFPRTFFGQLVLGTGLVQTLFLVLFIWYVVVSQGRAAEQRSQDRIQQQLDRLSAACSRELMKGDAAQLKDILDLSRIAPTINVVRLTTLKGETVVFSGNGPDRGLDSSEAALLPMATKRLIFQARNGEWEGVIPVFEGGEPVYLLWLDPADVLPVNTAGTVVRVCLTYGGFALIANLLPIFLVVQKMTRPLARLRQATHQLVRNPDLDTSFPLPVTSSNEAGELTVSVNQMVQQLDERRKGLLETLALLDSMLGNAPIGFAFFDRDLRYVRVNDFLASTHGVSVHEHFGRTTTDFYPESLATQKKGYLERVFETGEAIRDVQLSGEMPYAPGIHRTWLMHFYPVRTQEDSIKWVGVIMVEITQRLQAEEVLRKTEKLAAAGRLAASIAHEINNPLESVTNLLFLLGTHEPMDAQAKEFISMAQEELARVSEITQQTLRFYRQSTSPSMTNVIEALNSILRLYRPRLQSAQVKVIKRFAGEPEIFGFSGELRQLFANIIGNALDAMHDGGSLILQVRRGRGRGIDGTWGDGVRITIADNGIGMSEETRRRLFEPFYTTKETTGTGLGLWVSEEIIRKNQGTVRVKTRQGVKSGTCFMFFFPDRFRAGTAPARLTASSTTSSEVR